MTTETPFPQRRSIRLPNFDYSSVGMYFITLCAYDRKCVFGEIKDEIMHPSRIGEIIEEEWLRSAEIRKSIKLDEYILMPNHFHAIVLLDEERAHSSAPLQGLVRAPRSLSSLIAGFKATSTKRVNDKLATSGVKLWQRNFFERIIRNEEALSKAREYVINNPLKWHLDKENPNKL